MKPQTQTAKHTDIMKLLRSFENRLFASASDEYNERASGRAMKERYDACSSARNDIVDAINQLIAQRDALLECLQEVELLAREMKRSQVANIIVVKAKAAIALCEPKEKEVSATPANDGGVTIHGIEPYC